MFRLDFPSGTIQESVLHSHPKYELEKNNNNNQRQVLDNKLFDHLRLRIKLIPRQGKYK